MFVILGVEVERNEIWKYERVIYLDMQNNWICYCWKELTLSKNCLDNEKKKTKQFYFIYIKCCVDILYT